MKCWGRNDRGQLGNGSMVPKTIPVDAGIVAGACTQCDLRLVMNGIRTGWLIQKVTGWDIKRVGGLVGHSGWRGLG